MKNCCPGLTRFNSYRFSKIFRIWEQTLTLLTNTTISDEIKFMVDITVFVSKFYGGCEFQKKIVHLLFHRSSTRPNFLVI